MSSDEPAPRTHHERVDVDTRFLLANERTVLAWVRTGLSLIAVGLAVLQFGTDLHSRVPLGLALILAGSLASLGGWRRYETADRAIRAGALPPRGRAPQALALAVAFLGLALLVLWLLLRP
ncbi:MAG: YidH family protein [Candidatus Nanopelagicales bacterium]